MASFFRSEQALTWLPCGVTLLPQAFLGQLPHSSDCGLLARADGPRPTPQQLAWQKMELTMFCHFGVNTYTDRELGDGEEDEKIFYPVDLDCRQWARAAKTGKALLHKMWDREGQMFSDLDPQTGRRTQVRAAVCFYPYATDLVGAAHLPGFTQHLFDAEEFWTPFPVPSSSRQDPLYDPDAAWKGKRHNCPWNGRVWPMTNSHVAEAIARMALHHVPALRAHLAEFVARYVRMMFWDGDAERPNAFEHYHPVTGRPSAYRGIDDYQHSWINDLIAQYVVGLRPAGRGRLVVDPMPFALEGFEAHGLPMQGALVDVRCGGASFSVRVNGREAGRGTMGTPVPVDL